MYRPDALSGLFNPARKPDSKSVTLDRQHPINRGLVGLWPLDGNAFDLGPKRLHGGLVAMATGSGAYTAGARGGRALNLDGVDDFFQAANVDFGLNGATECSWSFWLKSSDTTGRVIGKQISSGFNSIYSDWGSTAGAAGKVAFAVQNSAIGGGEFPTWYNSTAVDGNWHFYLFTFKKAALGASDGILYIDGSPVSTTFSANGYDASFTIEESSNNLLFGARPLTGTDPFAGQIENVQVWNRKLQPAEAMLLYKKPFTGLRLKGDVDFFRAYSQQPAGAGNVISGGCTEGADAASGTVKVALKVSSGATETKDATSGTVKVALKVSSGFTETADASSGSIKVALKVSSGATETKDATSGSLTVGDTAHVSGNAAEGADSSSGTLKVAVKASGAIAQGADASAGNIRIALHISGGATESADASSGLVVPFVPAIAIAAFALRSRSGSMEVRTGAPQMSLRTKT